MESKEPLGVSPAVLAKRDLNKPSPWCQKFDIEFDSMCDRDNPKTILPKDVMKAAAAIKEDIPQTPLKALAFHGRLLDIPVTVVLPEHTLVSVVEKCLDYGASTILKGNSLEQAKLHAFELLAENGATYINGYDHPHVIAGAGTIGLEILEQLPQTDAILVPVSGGALIAGIAAFVKHFKPEVLIYGIEPVKCCAFFKAMENERPYQTAIVRSVAESLAVATAGFNAFHTAQSLIDKMKFDIEFDSMCDRDNPKTILPKDVMKAAAAIKEDILQTPLKQSRFTKNLKMDLYFKLELFHRTGRYDHPHVIAGAGTIGLEILEQLPQTDAILVPVSGGALIAGIAAFVKHFKPEVLIYGIEPVKCCAFFKAMENEQPYQTAVVRSVAESLAVATAGFNAFHTAQSLIDKMILVNDDWITRAVLHLLENEKIIVEGAGAVSMSALLAIPNILPELREKNVVCIITGGNMDVTTLPKCLERAKAVEGRLIKLTVTLPADELKLQTKVLSMIGNVGGNVLQCYIDRGWTTDDEFFTVYLTLIVETNGLEQACTLKRVMGRLFPGRCEFLEEPFSPIPTCACFPKSLG